MSGADMKEPTAAGAADEVLGAVDRGETLTDKVYARLRRGLLVGVWGPGEKITARQVSRDLGVSLTPAREAMMRLVNEGALTVSETRAFSAVALDLDQYREISRIRIALEPLAIAAAAERIADADAAALAALNERLAAMIREDRFHEALQIDSEFHLTIYDLCGQPTLRGIIDGLWLRAGPTRTRLSHSYRRRLVGYENHKRILAALRARDPRAASAALLRDLASGTEAVIQVMLGGEGSDK